LRRADELGLATQNGLGMLIYQAILADGIFLGQRLEKSDMHDLYTRVKEGITI
jgi:shikimate 5-dehydrogenase